MQITEKRVQQLEKWTHRLIKERYQGVYEFVVASADKDNEFLAELKDGASMVIVLRHIASDENVIVRFRGDQPNRVSYSTFPMGMIEQLELFELEQDE